MAGFLVGGLALLAAAWGVPIEDLRHAGAAIEWPYLLPAALVFLVQQTLRAVRQMVLLRAQFPTHRFRSSLAVLCIGFFFVNLLPARLGEVVRPLLLAENDNIPFGAGVAMVVVERVFDLVAMGVMVSVLAWTVPIPPSFTALLPGFDFVSYARVLVGVVVPMGVVGLFSLVVGGRPLLARAEAWSEGRVPAPLRDRVLRFLVPFVAGTAVVRDTRRMLAVVSLTATTWLLTGWLYPPIAAATGLRDIIGYAEGMGLLGVTMAGMALPAAPGFAGTYEAAVRAGLILYGVVGDAPLVPGGPSRDATALVFALVVHWWIHAVQSTTAVYFLVVDRVNPLRLARRAVGGASAS